MKIKFLSEPLDSQLKRQNFSLTQEGTFEQIVEYLSLPETKHSTKTYETEYYLVPANMVGLASGSNLEEQRYALYRRAIHNRNK
jgi:hypothetical protein